MVSLPPHFLSASSLQESLPESLHLIHRGWALLVDSRFSRHVHRFLQKREPIRLGSAELKNNFISFGQDWPCLVRRGGR
jgi:hypothetical protein